MAEKTLTEEQNAVKDRMSHADLGETIVLRGFAGTGKTYLASRIINSGRFKSPIVVAPTAVALNALKRKFAGQVPTGTVFNTFAYLTSRPVSLLKVGKYPKSYSVRLDDFSSSSQYEMSINDFVSKKKNVSEFIEQREDGDRVYYEADTEGLSKALGVEVTEDVRFDQLPIQDIVDRLRERDLVIIDEYSMIDEKKHALVVAVAAEFQAEGGDGPVFMVCGDAGQLQPVKGTINDAIRLEPDNHTVFELTKPMRSDDSIANFAQRLREGAKLGSMAASPNKMVLPAKGSITDIFNQHRGVFADADIALTWKNSNVTKLNELMRAQRGFSGTISAGESLVVTNNVYGGPGVIEWAKGEILTVISIADPASVVAKLDKEAPRIIESWRKKVDDLDEKIAKSKSKNRDTDEDVDETEKLIREQARLQAHIEDFEECAEEAKDLVETGLVGLAKVTDGFDTDTSERMAFISMHAVDMKDRVWRNQKATLRKVAWLFDAKPVDMTFAYALTVHKAQGSELDSVVYVAASGEIWAQAKSAYDGEDWHAPYTAVTRARKSVRVLYSSSNKIES